MFENEKKYFMDVNCFCRSMNKDEECDERCSYFNKCSKNNSPTNCLTRLNQCEEVLNTNKDVFPHRLVYPAIYSHFKHVKDGDCNNYLYVVEGVLEAIEVQNMDNVGIVKYIGAVMETETKTVLDYCIGKDGKLYMPLHNQEIKEGKYVIYNSMYDNMRYARPYDMFMSEVPEGKDNPSGQKYIFELVRY